MKKGILYGIGVGPGDPGLMTMKAVDLIKQCRVLAVPGEKADESQAYKIAKQNLPEIGDKRCLALPMPMIRSREAMRKEHEKNAAYIECCLESGEDVAFLTLGDPNIYSTFSYLRDIIKSHGHTVETVSGVTSFCAAASVVGEALAEWDGSVHIIPAGHTKCVDLTAPGTYVLMKPRGSIAVLKKMIYDAGKRVVAVTNCGMEDEHIYRSLEEIPDEVGYFTLLIVR